MNRVCKMEGSHYQGMLDSSILKPSNNQRLYNQLCQLTKGNFNVLLFGGSITAGYTPFHDITHPYPKLVETFLKEQFAATQFHFLNLGYAALHSLFGLAQVEQLLAQLPLPIDSQDLNIAQVNPVNLIFLEYAANNGFDMEYAKSFESLILKLLLYYPNAAIIIICTLNKDGYTCEPYMAKIADHYSLPVVSINNALTFGQSYGLAWDDYSMDNVHPTQFGHQIIADCVIQLIKTSFFQASEHKASELKIDSDLPSELNSGQNISLPGTPIYGNEFSKARYFDAVQIPEKNRGEFVPALTHPLFPRGLTCSEKSTLPLTLDLICEKLYLLYEQSADADISGKVAVDITTIAQTTIIDSFSIYAWGNPAMLKIIDGPKQTYSLRIKMLPSLKNSSFQILGFLYI